MLQLFSNTAASTAPTTMDPNPPLMPIRRTTFKLAQPTPAKRRDEFESVDDRGPWQRNSSLDSPTSETVARPPATSSDETIITGIRIAINDTTHSLASDSESVELSVGDRFEVTHIEFHSSSKTGLYSAEGFVSKFGEFSPESMLDYNDGRFSSGHLKSCPESLGTIPGLANSWVADSNWDRLNIVLKCYGVQSTKLCARFDLGLKLVESDDGARARCVRAQCFPIDSYRSKF